MWETANYLTLNLTFFHKLSLFCSYQNVITKFSLFCSDHFVITKLSLLWCYQFVITKLSLLWAYQIVALPNCHYQIVITKLTLLNCHYQKSARPLKFSKKINVNIFFGQHLSFLTTNKFSLRVKWAAIQNLGPIGSAVLTLYWIQI